MVPDAATLDEGAWRAMDASIAEALSKRRPRFAGSSSCSSAFSTRFHSFAGDDASTRSALPAERCCAGSPVRGVVEVVEVIEGVDLTAFHLDALDGLDILD